MRHAGYLRPVVLRIPEALLELIDSDRGGRAYRKGFRTDRIIDMIAAEYGCNPRGERLDRDELRYIDEIRVRRRRAAAEISRVTAARRSR